MIKKIITLAATALISLNASAGYIQYNLSGPVSGFFIQSDVDRSVAYYEFQVTAPEVRARLFNSGSYGSLWGSNWKMYGMGPTNFGVSNYLTEVYDYRMSLDFYLTETPGQYTYWANFAQTRSGGYPIGPWVTPLNPLSAVFSGSVVAVAPMFDTAWIDQYANIGMYPDGIPYIVPTRAIPEPASLGLLAIGALGALGISRRRKLNK